MTGYSSSSDEPFPDADPILILHEELWRRARLAAEVVEDRAGLNRDVRKIVKHLRRAGARSLACQPKWARTKRVGACRNMLLRSVINCSNVTWPGWLLRRSANKDSSSQRSFFKSCGWKNPAVPRCG